MRGPAIAGPLSLSVVPPDHVPSPSGETPSGRTAVRRLLIVLAIPLLLLVGADLGLRLVAQYLLGRELATSLNLSERPKVSLHGFPFLLHLAKGSFPTASATGSALRTQGLTFQSFQLTLNDVAFTPGKLVSGSAATIRAASGREIATVTGEQ